MSEISVRYSYDDETPSVLCDVRFGCALVCILMPYMYLRLDHVTSLLYNVRAQANVHALENGTLLYQRWPTR